MTRRVITASPDTPLHEIAALLENNSTKRVPIVKDDQLVGIISRPNLIQAVASGWKELEIRSPIRPFGTSYDAPQRATMSLKSSLRQSTQSVQHALMGYTRWPLCRKERTFPQ
jgi:CBS domain containing-hemolysin-like protein